MPVPIALAVLGWLAVAFLSCRRTLAIRVGCRCLTCSQMTQPRRRDLSVLTSVITTVLAIVLGVPLAWLLRSNIPGRQFIRALCTLSMVLPPVVAGVALLASLGRRGWLARYSMTGSACGCRSPCLQLSSLNYLL